MYKNNKQKQGEASCGVYEFLVFELKYVHV